MKRLLLHVGSDRPLLQHRLDALLPSFKVKATTPEKAVFAIFEGKFDWIVICSSVSDDRRQSLVKFLRRIDGGVPIVLVGPYSGEPMPGVYAVDSSLTRLVTCLSGGDLPAKNVLHMPALRSSAMAS